MYYPFDLLVYISREKINHNFSSRNSRAGFPYGAAEIFSLMQHMGCEPDRASYNILVDAYGKAGFQEGNDLPCKILI
jgi:pentatricopeptide repeat protein